LLPESSSVLYCGQEKEERAREEREKEAERQRKTVEMANMEGATNGRDVAEVEFAAGPDLFQTLSSDNAASRF
jgi:hypothetical protein